MNNKTENFSVSIEGGLLEILDAEARAEGKNRSAFIDTCVREYVLQKHSRNVWDTLYSEIVEKSCDGSNK